MQVRARVDKARARGRCPRRVRAKNRVRANHLRAAVGAKSAFCAKIGVRIVATLVRANFVRASRVPANRVRANVGATIRWRRTGVCAGPVRAIFGANAGAA